jgi:DNA gyrase subunit A
MSDFLNPEDLETEIGIEERSVDSEMKRAYLEYAMSVIIGRALPDARDGLKPVQRRVLYTMHKSGNHHNKPFVKSANIVGRTMGEHHPHGDSAIYDTMVRMAQSWQMRIPLIDGQGNWGCFSGDTTLLVQNSQGKFVSRSFSQLANDPDQEFSVISWNNQARRSVMSAPANNCRITRKQAPLVAVHLGEDSQVIRCTPDHLFLLQNGIYKPACELTSEDELQTAADLNFAQESLIDSSRNKRVSRVEYLSEKEDVYDISVDKFHNFLLGNGVFVHNSMDGDSASAYRYSEARMTVCAGQMLRDIGEETVDWTDNYDGQHKEPVVLPARFPALLVNGAAGIAVGMATQIPPHNLQEVIAAVGALIDDPDIDVSGLMQHIVAPDMPTGGLIVGRAGIRQAYETGRGRLIVRGVTHVEQRGGGRERIVVTEIPYSVQKGDGRGDGSGLIMKMVQLKREGKLPEIVDIRDESGADVRLVIDIAAGAIPQVVLNKLYKHTPLQLTTGINIVALNHGQPQTMNLKELLRAYLDHQIEVVTRRTRYRLNKDRVRAHLLEGLLIALDALDQVIAIIRGSDTQDQAEEALKKEFGFTKAQAVYILERQLRQLTSLNINAVKQEHTELTGNITHLRGILGSEKTILNIVREELEQVSELYGNERRSVLIPGEDDFDVEDLIPETLSVIMLTEAGYLKRVSLDAFRSQSRGGVGAKGVALQDGDDRLKIARIASTHEWILAFTNQGKLWRLRGWQVPEGGKGSKGRSLANLLPLDPNEKIVALCNTREFDQRNLLFATKKGIIKRTALAAYESNYRTVALRAIKLAEDDELIGVRITTDDQTAIVLSRRGRVQRFTVTEARKTGRNSGGVRAMRLSNEDSIVSLSVHDADEHLLLLTADGYGKQVPMSEFRISHRGGMGVRAIPEGSRGAVVGGADIEANDELLVITEKGMVQRLLTENISTYSRAARGVRVMRLGKNDAVKIMCIISAKEVAASKQNLAENDYSEEPTPVVTADIDLAAEDGEGGPSQEPVSESQTSIPERVPFPDDQTD